jgi:hypothetical protein
MKRLACFALVATAVLATHPALAAEPKSDKPAPPKPLAGSALLQLDDGRGGRGNLIATTGIRGFSKPASATAHALIMTIGDYQGAITKLKGVAYDAATATDIARRMGVPAENVHAFKDQELTLEGMRRAFDELESRLGGNDQVFVYYSGHGGRQLVQEGGVERCAESLITVDGQGFTDTEMEERLNRMAQKSQKTIVFLDACHSGGVTTRALGGATAAFTPKSWTPPGQGCAKPTNILTRSIKQAKPPGSGGANFVHIAAARDNEISLDQPGRGGVATQAWLTCMSGAATDMDGSGGLSAEEIRSCAQTQIEQQLKGAQGFLPHHVSINGNAAMVLSYAGKSAPTEGGNAESTSAPRPAGASTTAAGAGSAALTLPPVPLIVPTISVATGSAPNTAGVPIPPTGAVKPPSALAALTDIYNSRDDRRLVTVKAEKSVFTIGRDNIDFTLSSREGGYVYVLMVGSDGETFDLLFPNQIDRNHQIEAGASMRLPRPSWQLTAGGPPGKDTLLVIVADRPRDFAAAGLKPSGPFSAVDAGAAQDIQLVMADTVRSMPPECSDPASVRNITIKKRCSNGYGAALLTIEEVR